MDWRLFVSLRYFRIRRKDRFFSIITVISVLGIVVGVAALIVTLAVMSGFDRELKQRIVGTNAHIYIEGQEGIREHDPVIEDVLRENAAVKTFSPFVIGQVVLRSGKRYAGAVLTGVEEGAAGGVIDLQSYLYRGTFEGLTEGGIVVGAELARELNLRLGDELTLVTAVSARPFKFVVTGLFRSGLYTFDHQNVFVDIDRARELFALEGRVSGIAVRINDAIEAERIKEEINSELGFPYFVRTWIDLNRNLFSALKLEKITMFIVLTLIVIVASFNIASSLIVKVVQKKKDIGILRAIGASGRDIRSIFMIEGLFIGVTGTVVGTLAGLLLSWAQGRFKMIRLPQDIYYIDAVPIFINGTDILLIAVCAVLVSLAATVYPSLKGGRLKIADAVRYE